MRASCTRLDPRSVCFLAELTTKFYEEVLFGCKFPFPKLDHVLCPDARYAAMESAGCITYSEVAVSNKRWGQMQTSEKVAFNMLV